MMTQTLISGQAGVAVLLQGERVSSFHLDGPAGLERRREDIPQLFGHCTDVTSVSGLAPEDVPVRLEQEWAKHRCLILTLLLLDFHSDPEARLLTVPDIENFLTAADIAAFVRARLFAAPLPDDADLIGSINRAADQKAERLVELLEEVGTHQPGIALCRSAWDAVPTDKFKDTRHKEGLAFELVNSGAFHRLATTPAEKRGAVLVHILTQRQYQVFSGWREALTLWVNSVASRNSSVNRTVDEDDEDTPRKNRSRSSTSSRSRNP